MFEKLKLTEQKYEEISNKLTDPEVIGDNKLYASLMKEYKNLTPVVEKYREYVRCKKTMEDAKELLDEAGGDKEMKELAQLEFDESREALETLNEELKILLLPKDPNDDKNVIIEIRGGAGGEEASLFAGSLYRMYTMYAEARRWKTEILNANETELGGFKEVSFSVEGDGAYSRFKYESGVHRVQRVPETESQGRIHTSTVTVAVLAEADEVELEIAPTDLKIDVFRASGAGGQHINKTESAVRITHLPTGVVVECQDERSQHKNKDKAMKILRSRLYEALLEEQNDKIASERKSQVGTGNRSERIRTYNFPESRVTDHRIGLTLYRLESILNGSLDEVIDALATADQAAKLSAQLTQEDA
ncbi:MAG: peptide chain release factor 1 [Oscillospiraceae bacterium]|nr:peptide chain release factor 1 [Oscillospiraceae bacterium]